MDVNFSITSVCGCKYRPLIQRFEISFFSWAFIVRRKDEKEECVEKQIKKEIELKISLG
jgi:hypothetical protein